MRTQTIQEYRKRLESCGYSAHNAMRTCFDFRKEFSMQDLDLFVRSVEKDKFNVEILQPKSN